MEEEATSSQYVTATKGEKMKVRTMVFGGLLGVLALGSVAVAGSGTRGMQSGEMMGRMLSQLELTEEQKVLVFDARQDLQALKQETRQTRATLKTEAADMLSTNSVDAERLHELVDEGTALMATSMHEGLDIMLGIYESLDNDQRAELTELVAEKRAEKEEGRSRRGFDSQGGGF